MRLYKKQSKSFLGIILILTTSSFTIGSLQAQEYHEEIFLEFPVHKTHDADLLYGLKGIGIDNEDHLCALIASEMTIYNDSGEVLRKFTLQDETGKPRGGFDFCFDEAGYLYTTTNVSGNVAIYQFDHDGYLMGKMENDPRAAKAIDGSKRYLGENIACVPDYGLMLYNLFCEHIPVTFMEGKFPEMTRARNVKKRLRISKNNSIEAEFLDKSHIRIKVDFGELDTKTIDFKGKTLTDFRLVYSRDQGYQYYFIATKNEKTKQSIAEIKKYCGDELIASVGPLPPNRIEFAMGKRYVVDSRGTIYYYAGDKQGIQIIRYVLN